MKIRCWMLSALILTAFSYPIKGQQIINSFPSPGNDSRGLAWDGEYLWCADAGTDSVYKIDPVSGTILASFHFGIGTNYGGITWSDDNNIWIANGSRIYKVDPTDGSTVTSFGCGCW